MIRCHITKLWGQIPFVYGGRWSHDKIELIWQGRAGEVGVASLYPG